MAYIQGVQHTKLQPLKVKDAEEIGCCDWRENGARKLHSPVIEILCSHFFKVIVWLRWHNRSDHGAIVADAGLHSLSVNRINGPIGGVGGRRRRLRIKAHCRTHPRHSRTGTIFAHRMYLNILILPLPKSYNLFFSLIKYFQLWAFGWNKYGQLGLGHNASRDAPEKMVMPR